MGLVSGVYAPKSHKQILVWRGEPDAHGDGEQVWAVKKNEHGHPVGRVAVKDAWGQPVFAYKPPTGFRNFPSYTHEDCYCLVDERTGQPARTPTGEAISLKPGQAVILHADGSVTYLDDDYAQAEFELSHEPVEGVEVPRVLKDVPSEVDILSLPEFDENGLPVITGSAEE